MSQQQMRKSCLWDVGQCWDGMSVYLCLCLCLTLFATLWGCGSWHLSPQCFRALGEIQQGCCTQFFFRNSGEERRCASTLHNFLHPNTLPVTTASVESWELITSKGKCVKLGLKHDEVAHLFINRSSSSEVGLDVSFPWVQSRWKPSSPVHLWRVKVWADVCWLRIYLLGGNLGWLRWMDARWTSAC